MKHSLFIVQKTREQLSPSWLRVPIPERDPAPSNYACLMLYNYHVLFQSLAHLRQRSNTTKPLFLVVNYIDFS